MYPLASRLDASFEQFIPVLLIQMLLSQSDFVSLYAQGVLRVRKRVTMMVIAVSAIFGICWGAESIEYVLRHFTSYKMSPVPAAISDAMALLNSAVNPFVFALLNQQFREKINGMICCKASMRVHPTRESHNMEFTNNNSTSPTNINC